MHDAIITAAAVIGALSPFIIGFAKLLLGIRDRLSRIEGYLWPSGELRRRAVNDN